MVPWRLAQGEALYRDVHFHHGPLAPWLGALSDRVFGRSLPARTSLAAGIALLHLAALSLLARRFLSPWRAALATSLAVAIAVFLRPGGWLFPFSFDTAIAVAALTWALVLLPRGDPRSDGLAGFCLLAALLARVEMGLAGAAVLAIAARREPLRLLRLAFFPMAAGGVTYAVLSLGTPFERLVSDGWLCVIDPPAAFRNVYRTYAGLDQVALRSAETALASIVVALIAVLLVATAFAGQRLESAHRGAARAAEALGLTMLAAAAAFRIAPPASLAPTLALFPPLVRVIPPCVVIAGLWRVLLRLRHEEPRGPLARIPDPALWLAALFAARLLLAAGYVGPYDAFFLPLPTVVCVAGLFAIADRAAPAVGRALPRLTACALGLFLAWRGVTVLRFFRQPGWSLVQTPAGNLRLPEPVAEATRETLQDLRGRVSSSSRLSGFPETGFFNYVLGVQNPFWLEQFFPGHLDPAGEARAIARLTEGPPEVLLYANVLAVGEGQRAFGTDYLQRLDAAARAVSTPVAIFGPGARPGARIGDPGFFVEIRALAQAHP